MAPLSRRRFAALSLPLAARLHGSASTIDQTLRDGIRQRSIPCVVAMVSTAGKVTYSGAFGVRDSASGAPVAMDSIFRIASMTKALTTLAAMQLVEQGKLKLRQPVAGYLPEFARIQVLEGFDDAGQPKLRPARRPVTLHHLLTHTAGFGYDNWNPDTFRWMTTQKPAPDALTPLVFDPGDRWLYGTNIDWVGRLVEKVAGLTLEEYFQRHIIRPLAMEDTSYILPPGRFPRLVSSWVRQPSGELQEQPRQQPNPPKTFNGGGGLYSTAADYVRFMEMFLRGGRTASGTRLLKPETLRLMMTNRIGAISAGKLTSARPDRSSDVDFHPGVTDGFTYGFLINSVAYDGGRSAGSLAWAGIQNTFYWIDPKRSLCAVILMQFYPFCDGHAMSLLRDFERAIYAA